MRVNNPHCTHLSRVTELTEVHSKTPVVLPIGLVVDDDDDDGDVVPTTVGLWESVI